MTSLDLPAMTAAELRAALIRLYVEQGENDQQTARYIGRDYISGQSVSRLRRAEIGARQGGFRPNPGTVLGIARAAGLSPTDALDAAGFGELADYLRQVFGKPQRIPDPQYVPLLSDPLFRRSVKLWSRLNEPEKRQVVEAFWSLIEACDPPKKRRRPAAERPSRVA